MKNILKKSVCSVLLVFLSNSSFSQGVVGMPELNVLYHGYDNIVQLGFQDGLDDVSLKAEGAILTKTSKGYIVRTVKGSRQTEIIGTLKNGDTVCHYYYRNMFLSTPVLFWGTAEDGGQASSEESLLVLRYPNGVIFENEFNIIDWMVTIGDQTIKGKGDHLNDEVRKCIYSQELKDVTVSVVVTAKSNLNQLRQISAGIYTITNPYFQKSVLNAKVFFIDRDSSNNEIFDASNPFSLIGLVQRNLFRDQLCLSKIQSQRLLENGANLTLQSVEYKPQIALLEDDPTKSNYKDLQIDTLSDGTLQFRYAESPKFFYDVQDINRIVLYQSTFIDKISGQRTYGISHVGLAKKYLGSEKYDVVCVLPFHEISSLSEIETIQKIVDTNILNLYKYILPNIDNGVAYSAPYQGAQLEYFPNVRNQYGDLKLPFFSNSFEVEKYSNEFDTMVYKVLPSQVPLWNIYGEDSTRTLNNGTVEVVYEPSMKIYELILAPDEDITMYLNYKIELISTEIGLEPCFIPRKVVYTVKTEDGEYAFCEVQILESNWFNEFKNYCFPISQFEWKKLIREAIENGRSYDLLNKKDIKALDKEFNLDSYMGVPANLLGVCVGCN
jgi:hypothetical protein